MSIAQFPRVQAIIAVPNLRWVCRHCGRFVSEKNIISTDYPDPLGSYYGIRSETQYYCSRCGLIEDEPRLADVGLTAFALDPFAGNGGAS